MRFELLGPLRVLATEDHQVAIKAGRERILLAMLLLRAGNCVSMDSLVEAIWDDEPPHSARGQVHACVSHLRRRLTAAGIPGDLVNTDPSGYRARADPKDVDVHEFRALLADARAAAAARNHDQARDRYREAIGRWRGPALAGIDSIEVRRAAAALDEEHTQAIEERIEIELAMGRAGELVGELTELVQRHPYREGMHGALMRALYRTGRPGDALAAYRRAWQLLHDELGTEPGADLQRLHQAILNQEPLLETPSSAAPAPPTTPAPQELPVDASRFVGREHEIAQVRQVLVPPDRDAHRRPTMVALYGPGGVGKSTLAVRVAHELADRFPDGQMYVDLCGSTPGMRPLPAVEVLGRFLRRLGTPPDQIPPDQAEAAALFRTVTSGRRLLLVLDNAADKDQVAPLLPGTPSCGVLVTSRHPLSSLDVDRRLRLGVLPDADGLALFTGLTDGLTADPDAAQAIVSLSGGLPLAIRIAAGRLASRPDVPASEYARRLASRSRRLDELKLDDLAVRASIRTSYDALGSGHDPIDRVAARAFRMLGILHVPDVAPGVVAAMLTEPDVDTARTALDRLVEAQLVEPIPGGRYRLHDLVRLVATETATEQESPGNHDQALDRAVAQYGATSLLASSLLFPGRSWVFAAPRFPSAATLPPIREPSQARTWVETELPNLVAVVEQTTARPPQATRGTLRFSEEVWTYLHIHIEWQTALRLSRLMLDTGLRAQEMVLAGWGHLAVGRMEANLGDYASATVHLKQALRIFRELDCHAGTVSTLMALGIASHWRGEPSTALRYHTNAIERAKQHCIESVQVTLLLNVSSCYISLGRLDDAASASDEAVGISRREWNMDRLAGSLNNLAAAHSLRGRLQEAVSCADEALACAREVGNQLTVREILGTRAVAHLWRGAHAEAVRDADEFMRSARISGDRYAEAAGLRLRAKILAATGRSAEAAEANNEADTAYAHLTFRRDPVIETLIAHHGPSSQGSPTHAGRVLAAPPDPAV